MEEEKNTAAAVDWEEAPNPKHRKRCLLYTSDAADEL